MTTFIIVQRWETNAKGSGSGSSSNNSSSSSSSNSNSSNNKLSMEARGRKRGGPREKNNGYQGGPSRSGRSHWYNYPTEYGYGQGYGNPGSDSHTLIASDDAHVDSFDPSKNFDEDELLVTSTWHSRVEAMIKFDASDFIRGPLMCSSGHLCTVIGHSCPIV